MALPQVPPDSELVIDCARFVCEPTVPAHGPEFARLMNDPRLHAFVPLTPENLNSQLRRCLRWSRRASEDGSCLTLNWFAREKSSGELIAHFQVTLDDQPFATLGYMIAFDKWNQGIATEGLHAVMALLGEKFGVNECRAWIDSRNAASIALMKKLGGTQVGFVKDADFFKGSTSDEVIYSVSLLGGK